MTVRDINSILSRINGPLGEDDFIEPLSILLLDHKHKSKFNTLGQLSTQQAILTQLNYINLLIAETFQKYQTQ